MKEHPKANILNLNWPNISPSFYPSQGKIKNSKRKEAIKVFSFDGSRPTKPDFVLFPINHKPEENLQYQQILKPKEEHIPIFYRHKYLFLPQKI